MTVEQMGSEPTIVMEPVGSVSLPWTGAEAYTVQIVSNVNWRAELTVVSGGEGWIAKTAPAAERRGRRRRGALRVRERIDREPSGEADGGLCRRSDREGGTDDQPAETGRTPPDRIRGHDHAAR